MRDATIFKLALAAGALAFVYQLVTVSNVDLGVEPESGWQRDDGPMAEARRKARDGEFIEAARIVTAVHAMSPDRLNQGPWGEIGRYLKAAGEPTDALGQWRAVVPAEVIEQGAALGWVSYFTGYEWLRHDEREFANEAWAIGEVAFEQYLLSHADIATEWDWLYLARTRMRMERYETGREAMEDVRPFLKDAVTPESIATGGFSFVQTSGRTWAEVGRPDETSKLWRQVTEARATNGQSYRMIAFGWLEVASAMTRSHSEAAVRVSLDEAVNALERSDQDVDQRSRIPVARIWNRIGWSYYALEDLDAAAAAHVRSLDVARIAVAKSRDRDTLLQWAQSAMAAGALEEAIDTLEEGVAEGWFRIQFLADSVQFNSLREIPRFEALIAPAVTNDPFSNSGR